MKSIQSLNELKQLLQANEQLNVLIVKSGNPQSDCALANYEEAMKAESEAISFSVDVNHVRDIHPEFGITSAPTLLIFNNKELINSIKGCQGADYYQAVTSNQSFARKTGSDGKPAKQVIVYSTPTCSWCNTLKGWLRKNQVAFREVDVSRDQQAAEAMVRKSGQQGVPQTEIDGQIVVGFDQTRLKNLLGINS